MSGDFKPIVTVSALIIFTRIKANVYRALTFQAGANGARGIFPMVAVKQAKAEFSGIAEAVRYDGR